MSAPSEWSRRVEGVETDFAVQRRHTPEADWLRNSPWSRPLIGAQKYAEQLRRGEKGSAEFRVVKRVTVTETTVSVIES